MNRRPLNFAKTAALAILMTYSVATIAQDGTIYPLDAPAEPNAIPLNTGGVDNQPAQETWFRQWGDPMARNITKATLTPFFAESRQGKRYNSDRCTWRWLQMAVSGK